jgi:hypothetical protein
MLERLSEEIRACLEHAAECAHQARFQQDAILRQDYLVMEQRWLKLARSYEFAERLGRFASCDGE